MSRREWIENSIWDDPAFEELSPLAKLVYLWASTNPRCGMAGLYPVSKRRMLHDIGQIGAAELDDALADLTDVGLMLYAEGVVYLPRRIRELKGRNPFVTQSICNDVQKLAPEHPLRVRFLKDYADKKFRPHVTDEHPHDLPDLLLPLMQESFPETVSRPSPDLLGKARQGKDGQGADGRGKVRSGDSEVVEGSYVEEGAE